LLLEVLSQMCRFFYILFYFRCAQAVVDPYDSIDKDAWTDNLEKGGLQSFM